MAKINVPFYLRNLICNRIQPKIKSLTDNTAENKAKKPYFQYKKKVRRHLATHQNHWSSYILRTIKMYIKILNYLAGNFCASFDHHRRVTQYSLTHIVIVIVTPWILCCLPPRWLFFLNAHFYCILSLSRRVCVCASSILSASSAYIVSQICIFIVWDYIYHVWWWQLCIYIWYCTGCTCTYTVMC